MEAQHLVTFLNVTHAAPSLRSPWQPDPTARLPPMTEDAVASRSSRALLLRYLVIGVLSIGIDVGLLYSLHSIVGVQLSIATTIAFLSSVVFNFLCNRITMARGQAEQLMRHAYRYGVLVVANLCITAAVVSGAAHIGVQYVIAKLAVVAASTCWNFVLYRRWVFTERA